MPVQGMEVGKTEGKAAGDCCLNILPELELEIKL